MVKQDVTSGDEEEDVGDLSKGRRQAGTRYQRLKIRLDGFHYRETEAWSYLTNRFGSQVKLQELVSVAVLMGQVCYLRVDRDAKRSKAVIIKWFEENWDVVRPFLDYVVLAELPQDGGSTELMARSQ